MSGWKMSASAGRADQVNGWLAAALISGALLLGGASGPGAGAFANALLQLFALGVIIYIVAVPAGRVTSREAKPIWWLLALSLFAVGLQFVPLPPDAWRTLPGRGHLAEGYEMLGLSPPALHLSLTPQNSLASSLWLLPPVATFLLVVQTPVPQRRRLPLVVLGITTVSIALGVAQLLGGPESPLRFYAITNVESPVGFFANVNNQAMLALCAMPLIGALTARAARHESQVRRRSSKMLGAAVWLFLAIGVAITGSLAGLGLLLPASFASLLIYRRAVKGRLGVKWAASASLLFGLFIALAFVGPLNQEALGQKLGDEPTSRRVMAQNTLRAIGDYFPVGSGLGSFPDIYRHYEDPATVTSEYVNHAHNDYLELVLELGIVGLGLILLFAGWFFWRAWRVWTGDFDGAVLARAGVVIIAILALHSLVEFPLRTAALATIFAMACAFLVPYGPGRSAVRRRMGEPKEALRHLRAE
jgi:O-antigen ligase